MEEVKNSNKAFFIKVASRKGLAYMLGDNKEALKELNSLSDAEIQQAIESIAVVFSFHELFENCLPFLFSFSFLFTEITL